MKRLLFLIPLLLCTAGDAAEYRTPNFTVTASDAALAKRVGDSAEHSRAEHAREWLGKELPRWYAPCPIRVKSGQLGSGGATTFSFENGEVFGWNMFVQGSPDRIVNTVVPHEVLHTVFACHFRRGLPRWADEGAASYVEEESEKKRQRLLAAEVVGTEEQIPIRKLLNLQEYPADMRAVLVLYAQGFYISEFLIEQKGKREFVRFLETYFKGGDWDAAFKAHYGFPDQEAAYTAAWKANRVLSDALEVKLIVSANCVYCDKAKQNTLPALKSKGVKVAMIDAAQSPEPVAAAPAFILYRNGQRVGRLDGYQSAAQVMGEYNRLKGPVTVKAAQGIGIGVFGAAGGSSGRANPHTDLNPAQLQIINRAIDDRAGLIANNVISSNLGNLDVVIDGRISAAVLKIRSELTPEQKAFINATDAQKTKLDELTKKIETVEAGKLEFQKTTAAQVEKVKEDNQALAQKVETAEKNATEMETSIVGKVVEKVKDKLPSGVISWAAFGVGAVKALLTGGPPAVALFMGARLLARKEEKTPTPADK